MASGIYTEIKKRIELAEPGTVFITSDFTDIATTTTVRTCLGRQVEEKNIRNGNFEKYRTFLKMGTKNCCKHFNVYNSLFLCLCTDTDSACYDCQKPV